MSLKICPSCHKGCMDSNVTCPSCGANLDGAPQQAPTTSKFCPECGSQLTGTSKFCNNCGTALGGSPAPQPAVAATEPLKTGDPPPTAPLILGLIGGVFGIFTGIAVLVFSGIGFVLSQKAAETVMWGGVGSILFSIIGIVGAALVKSKTKTAGYLMIVSAIGGAICISLGYTISFLLLIIGGILAVRFKE